MSHIGDGSSSSGVGSKRVHVPLSPAWLLTTRPQFVPTKTSDVPGRSAIPNAEGCAARAGSHVLGAAGRRPLQVSPPSVDTWSGAAVSTRPSLNEVANTRCPPGSTATSQVVAGRWPSRWVHDEPPSVDLNRPPPSLAAK